MVAGDAPTSDARAPEAAGVTADVALFNAAPTPNVIVRFRVPGPAQQFTNPGLTLQRGMDVVVHVGVHVGVPAGPKGAAGAPSVQEEALGTVVRTGMGTLAPSGDVIRRPTEHDINQGLRNREREREASAFCRERIKALTLSMKLVGVEIAHDASHAVFHFTSAERVDFRVLVKDLARRLHMRIEMRQIGVRDAARQTGGTGICGQSLCCSTWLPEFQPISIRMAKDQNLSLNQQKLSGLCGRLRCCLQYEQSTYQEERKTLPKVGKKVITPQGEGRVKDVNVLRRRVRVALLQGGIAEFDAAEITRPAEPVPVPVHTGPTETASARKRRRRKRKTLGGQEAASGAAGVDSSATEGDPDDPEDGPESPDDMLPPDKDVE